MSARSRGGAEPELPFPAGDEPLELLLPDASAEQHRRAQRVTSFLRLLSADARGRGAAAADADLERAQRELERQARAQRRELLEDLLAHHLRAHVGGESFAGYGEPARGAREAWSLVESSRGELDLLPDLPAPGESALEVAQRLVEALERSENEVDDDPRCGERAALAGARFVHAAEGASAGQQRFEALLERDLSPPVRAAALAGLVEASLDRGAVRDALSRLEDQRLWVRGDRRLSRLAVWARVLAGDLEGARCETLELGPWEGLLPAPLVELREELPEALLSLSGRAHPEAPRAAFAHALDRRELGASFLAIVRFGPGRAAQVLHGDAAPGLRAQLEAWIADREGACAIPTEPEHRLVLSARAYRGHRTGCAPLAGALGRDSARALVLAPILADGEVAGWVHLEFEHHLLPSTRRLEALAAEARAQLANERVCARCGSASATPRAELAARDPATEGRSVLDHPLDGAARTLAGEAFSALARALAFKTQTRAWWGIDAQRGAPRLAASGGEGLAPEARAMGRARAVARSLATGGSVLFEEADPRLSIHARAASGVVIPLAVRGAVCGALAIESERRRDFRAGDLARFEEIARPFALALRAAQFRAWHLERYGFDLFLDASSAGFREWADGLVAAARSRAPLVFTGERGSGRTVLARWAHFESGGADEPLAESDPTGAGNRLIEHLSALSAEAQAALARAIDAGGARVFATDASPLADSMAQGTLAPELAARFERLELSVPPLRDRREEIPGLARFFAARFAAEEREREPSFREDALALLWRQSWEGNLRQLEAFVFKLVLLHPGEELTAQTIEAVARRFRLPLLPRLASRHPRRRDLAAALRTTRLGSERINKRRAAAHLGWDPDTLIARLEEAHLDNELLDREPGPWQMDAESALRDGPSARVRGAPAAKEATAERDEGEASA